MKTIATDTIWVVFSDGVRELARMPADLATPEEIEENCDLLAGNTGFDPDDIVVRLAVSPFSPLVTDGSEAN